jgi:hypothetical protein
MLFKHSKYCEIESPKKIVENVRISNEEIIDFCKEHPGYKLPISVTTVSKYKLNLLEFVKYLKNHHYDIEYVTKEEYVKENPYKQPFMGFK